MKTAPTMSMYANRRDYDRAMALRDLDAPRQAQLATWLWPSEYAKSGLGCMGFWDGLSERRQQYCRDCLHRVLAAREEVPANSGIKPDRKRTAGS